MTKEYICDLCKKVFNQKIDFTRHRNKKAPCITLDELQQISQINDAKTDNKTKLSLMFKYCLDVLRNKLLYLINLIPIRNIRINILRIRFFQYCLYAFPIYSCIFNPRCY